VPAVQFILVRHAQPVRLFNPDGPADPGLSDLGRWQAERLVSWLAHEPVDHIVTSPKRRAIETVGGLLDGTAHPEQRVHPHLIVDDFDEIDRRANHYLPTELLSTEGGEYWERIMRQEWDAIGWDPPEVFNARVDAAWVELCANPPGEHVVLACHGGVIRRIAAHVLGTGGMGRFDISYASITRVEVDDKGKAGIVTLNEMAHFDARREQVTERIKGRPS
jgi:probable phosphoglycerate mutase